MWGKITVTLMTGINMKLLPLTPKTVRLHFITADRFS
jgi:hypothetical protein